MNIYVGNLPRVTTEDDFSRWSMGVGPVLEIVNSIEYLLVADNVTIRYNKIINYHPLGRALFIEATCCGPITYAFDYKIRPNIL